MYAIHIIFLDCILRLCLILHAQAMSCDSLMRPNFARLGIAEHLNKAASGYRKQEVEILRSNGFNLLNKQYQFALNYDDRSFVNRARHSQDVAVIGEAIAKNIGLSEASQALMRVLGLAHDLGHPPFSHTGQGVFNQRLPSRPFSHDFESISVLSGWDNQQVGAIPMEVAEGILKKYWRFDDGRAKGGINHHTSELPIAFRARKDFAAFYADQFNHLEGQIIAAADRISYTANDISEGLRVGRIKLENLATDFPLVNDSIQEIINEIAQAVSPRFIKGTPNEIILSSIMSSPELLDYIYREFAVRFKNFQIDELVRETIANLSKITALKPDLSAVDIRTQDQMVVQFSARMQEGYRTSQIYSNERNIFVEAESYTAFLNRVIDFYTMGQLTLPEPFGSAWRVATSADDKMAVVIQFIIQNVTERQVFELVEKYDPKLYKQKFIGLESAKAPLYSKTQAIGTFLSQRGLKPE